MSDLDEPPQGTSQWVSAPASAAKLREQLQPAILSVLVLTLLSSCIFPLLLFAIGGLLFPRQAGGSLILRGGAVVGSQLIGQQFTRPEYFQSRPSAAGSGYDGTAAGGTNLGPNNPKLKSGAEDFAGIRQLAEEYRKRNGLAPDAAIPIDAVTRSASGLDPHISPANTALQIPSVARARGLSEDAVRRLVADHTEGPQLGLDRLLVSLASSAALAIQCLSRRLPQHFGYSQRQPYAKATNPAPTMRTNHFPASRGRLSPSSTMLSLQNLMKRAGANSINTPTQIQPKNIAA
jgi:K+-transporting ATPase ATPase C chain